MRTQLFSSGMTVGGWLASAALAMSISTVTHAETTISGTPPTTVKETWYYGFQSWATDTDGRTVTYSIKNKPSWATFSTEYGHLYGTPPASAVGVYQDIVISASDGVSSASLPPFSITVTGPGGSSGSGGGSGSTGSATVSWKAPILNTNGTAITNLAGYEIKYGTSASNLSTTVKVASASTTSYVIANLAAGTYYFGVSAYNSAGEMSSVSSVASKTVK
jgi:Putative Ig domain/Fibronectin type III domain